MDRFDINGEKLITTTELARATGLHPLDLEDAAEAGVVPSVRLGTTRLFLLSTFTEAVAAQVRARANARNGGAHD